MNVELPYVLQPSQGVDALRRFLDDEREQNLPEYLRKRPKVVNDDQKHSMALKLCCPAARRNTASSISQHAHQLLDCLTVCNVVL